MRRCLVYFATALLALLIMLSDVHAQGSNSFPGYIAGSSKLTTPQQISPNALIPLVQPSLTGPGGWDTFSIPYTGLATVVGAAAIDLSNVAISGDCTNILAVLTCTKIGGKAVALGGSFTTLGGAATLSFPTPNLTFTYPAISTTLAANDLSNVTLTGDCGNSGSLVTCTKINGVSVNLGGTLTTAGPVTINAPLSITGGLTVGGALTTTGTGPTTLAFPSGSATFSYPGSSKTLAANDLSNVTFSGDCANALAVITCTSLDGRAVSLGGTLTTLGAVTINAPLSITGDMTVGGAFTTAGALTTTGTGPTTLTFPSESATFAYPSTSKTLAANDLSNITFSGDCSNALAVITCTALDGRAVSLGGSLTTLGAVTISAPLSIAGALATTGSGSTTLAFPSGTTTFTYPGASATLMDSAGANSGSSAFANLIASASSGIVTPLLGGTGVSNGTRTLTLGGFLTTTGTTPATLAFPSAGPMTFTYPSASKTLAANDLSNVTLSGDCGNTLLAITCTSLGGKPISLGAGLTTTGTTATTLAFPSSGTPTFTYPATSATLAANDLSNVVPSPGRQNLGILYNISIADKLNGSPSGAICDGGHHPISGFFSGGTSLATMQVVYPTATSTSNEVDGVAINNALIAARTQMSSAIGGAKVIGSGYCRSDVSLNLTNLQGTTPFVFDLSGGVIYSTAAGLIAFDMSGANSLTIQNMTLYGDPTNTPKIGIQMTRTTAFPSSAAHRLYNVLAYGSYTQSTWYNMSSEGTTCVRSQFFNAEASPGAFVYIADGINHFNASSQYVTVGEPTNTPYSFTQDVYLGCEFRSSTANPAMWISNSADHTFIDCYFLTSGSGGSYAIYLYNNALTDKNNNLKFLNTSIEQTPGLASDFFVTGPYNTPSLPGFTFSEEVDFASGATFKEDTNITSVYLLQADIGIAFQFHPVVIGTSSLLTTPALWTISGKFMLPDYRRWVDPGSFQAGSACFKFSNNKCRGIGQNFGVRDNNPVVTTPVTISIANPAVITYGTGAPPIGSAINFTTTGALPSPIVPADGTGTGQYYVIAAGYGGTASNAITAASWSNNVVTFTTTSPHGLSPGSSFTIANMVPDAYNGSYTSISPTSGNTLTAVLVGDPGPETALGQATYGTFEISTSLSGTPISTLGSTQSGTQTANAGVILKSATAINLAALQLPAGSFVCGQSTIWIASGGSVMSLITSGLSTTTGTLPNGPDLSLYRLPITFAANITADGGGYGQRYDLATPTELDLVTQSNFASGAVLATGSIQCTKVMGSS